MIIIVQTSDGTEISRFDEDVTDDPGLSGDIKMRFQRTAKALSEFLKITQKELAVMPDTLPSRRMSYRASVATILGSSLVLWAAVVGVALLLAGCAGGSYHGPPDDKAGAWSCIVLLTCLL